MVYMFRINQSGGDVKMDKDIKIAHTVHAVITIVFAVVLLAGSTII